MRILISYETETGAGQVRTRTGDACRVEAHYQKGMIKLMEEARVEPLALLLWTALKREAQASGGVIKPFKKWLEEDLVDMATVAEDGEADPLEDPV